MVAMMHKTWYFKYNRQNFCAKLKKNQIWFFFGEQKLNNIWYKYKPYVKYEVIEFFMEKYYDLELRICIN